MKKIIALVLSFVIVMAMASFANAEIQTVEEYATEDGTYVAIMQDDENYETWLKLTSDYEDDLSVSLILEGNPIMSSELLEMLQFFNLGEEAFSSLDGRLDYLRVLVSLGLSEGNM